MQFESVTCDNIGEGARLAFGEIVNTVYRVDQADVILALDLRVLDQRPVSLRYARNSQESAASKAPNRK